MNKKREFTRPESHQERRHLGSTPGSKLRTIFKGRKKVNGRQVTAASMLQLERELPGRKTVGINLSQNLWCGINGRLVTSLTWGVTPVEAKTGRILTKDGQRHGKG